MAANKYCYGVSLWWRKNQSCATQQFTWAPAECKLNEGAFFEPANCPCNAIYPNVDLHVCTAVAECIRSLLLLFLPAECFEIAASRHRFRMCTADANGNISLNTWRVARRKRWTNFGHTFILTSCINSVAEYEMDAKDISAMRILEVSQNKNVKTMNCVVFRASASIAVDDKCEFMWLARQSAFTTTPLRSNFCKICNAT